MSSPLELHATWLKEEVACIAALQRAEAAEARVQELERELDGDGSHNPDPKIALGLRKCLELQAETIALLERKVAEWKAIYVARQHDDTKQACDDCEQCGPPGTVMCSYHSLLSELADRVKVT